MAGGLSGFSAALVDGIRSSISSARKERSSRNDRCILTRAVNLAQLLVLSWWTRPSLKAESTEELDERWGIMDDHHNGDNSGTASRLWTTKHHRHDTSGVTTAGSGGQGDCWNFTYWFLLTLSCLWRVTTLKMQDRNLNNIVFFLFTGCLRDQAANQDTLSYLTAQL